MVIVSNGLIISSAMFEGNDQDIYRTGRSKYWCTHKVYAWLNISSGIIVLLSVKLH